MHKLQINVLLTAFIELYLFFNWFKFLSFPINKFHKKMF